MTDSNTHWPQLSKPPTLNPNEIHVWHADLELPAERINQLYKLLNTEEQQRANRFHFERDKTRFIAARGTLRKLLGFYTETAPEQLQFNYTEYGKPYLIQKPDLQFNLSHAHNKALIAITQAPAVGVDIEYCNKEVDIDGIAQRFFSANEKKIITTLTGVKKQQAFFNAWVRKEAFMKALGTGLSYSLEKIEVSILPEKPAEIIALHDNAQNIKEWSLFALDVPAPYAAALIIKGIGYSLIKAEVI